MAYQVKIKQILVETMEVVVRASGQRKIINKSDFNPEIHEKPGARKETRTVREEKPAPVQEQEAEEPEDEADEDEDEVEEVKPAPKKRPVVKRRVPRNDE